jgi:selenocysteine-specific elongation factor
VQFSPDQQARADAVLEAFRADPYATPSVSDCIEELGEGVFHALIEERALVRIHPDVVFTPEALGEMKEGVIDLIRAEGSVTIAQVRDLFRTSRKYAVALMEYLDQEHVTRRVGDVRVLR